MKLVEDNPLHALAAGSDIHLLHSLFNASAASRRVFSEVHYYEPEDPHLTIGMGHWIRTNIATLFAKLRSDAETWHKLRAIWAATLEHDHWEQIKREASEVTRDEQGLDRALGAVLCPNNPSKSCVEDNLIPWTQIVGEVFNTTDHWFTAGWKAISKLEPVARVQAEHWAATVLEPGVTAATKRGLETRGGVACVISAKSSGLGSTMFKVGATKVKATGAGVTRRWSLDAVPKEARPDNPGGIDADRLLQDWQSVVAWQYYCVKKRRVRSRMRAIWEAFFEDSWGPLSHPKSLSKSTLVPQHSGFHMSALPFDFSVTWA